MTATERHEAALRRRDEAERVYKAAQQTMLDAQRAFDAARAEVRATYFAAWLEQDRSKRPTPDRAHEFIDEVNQQRRLRYLSNVTKTGTLQITLEIRSPMCVGRSYLDEEIRRTRKDYAEQKAKWGVP